MNRSKTMHLCTNKTKATKEVLVHNIKHIVCNTWNMYGNTKLDQVTTLTKLARTARMTLFTPYSMTEISSMHLFTQK